MRLPNLGQCASRLRAIHHASFFIRRYCFCLRGFPAEKDVKRSRRRISRKHRTPPLSYLTRNAVALVTISLSVFVFAIFETRYGEADEYV